MRRGRKGTARRARVGVAAAVILKNAPNRIPRGLNNSKKLNAAARETLYEKIAPLRKSRSPSARPTASIATTSCALRLWALARAVKALPVKPKMVFVDGNMKIDCGCDCEAVVSGDALVMSIAAASIVAKVTRDRLMARVGAGLSGLRLRNPQGLCRAGTSRGAGPARTKYPPPPVFRTGHCRAAETLSRAVEATVEPDLFAVEGEMTSGISVTI